MSSDSITIIKNKVQQSVSIKKPRLYKVIFHNDDFTPFEYVQLILMLIFNKSKEEALFLTQEIHNSKKAIIGIYPKEIALTKKTQTDLNSKKNNYPLLCEIEPE